MHITRHTRRAAERPDASLLDWLTPQLGDEDHGYSLSGARKREEERRSSTQLTLCPHSPPHRSRMRRQIASPSPVPGYCLRGGAV
jgi:hypothetical protein